MHKHQDRPASSRQWLRRHDILNFISTLYEGDLHAKRVLSLANATQGVLTSASLAIHAVGRGLAQAMGTLTKHGVKQVDRLLSNRGVDVWAFFAYWTPFIVAARTEVVVALDWTSFAADGQDTIVLSMVTGHGRATPLLWKTVASSTLKGNQRRYEYELLCRLREVLPAGVKVTLVADRGFGDCKLFYALTTELAFEYVIRLRGDIYVTSAGGERRTQHITVPVAQMLVVRHGPVRPLVHSVGVAVGNEPAFEHRSYRRMHRMVHHPVAKRRRRYHPPFRFAHFEGNITTGPPRARQKLALQGQDLGFQVGQKRRRTRHPPLARHSAQRGRAERLERCDPLEQAVSPGPPHAPSASRR